MQRLAIVHRSATGRSPSGLVSVKILVICSRALSNAPVATLPTAKSQLPKRNENARTAQVQW